MISLKALYNVGKIILEVFANQNSSLKLENNDKPFIKLRSSLIAFIVIL